MPIGALADGWDGGVINMLVEVWLIEVRADVVIVTLAGVETIVAAAFVSASKFAAPISYRVDMLSNMVVDALVDALASVMICLVLDIGFEVLADATGNVFTSLMTALENAVPKP